MTASTPVIRGKFGLTACTRVCGAWENGGEPVHPHDDQMYVERGTIVTTASRTFDDTTSLVHRCMFSRGARPGLSYCKSQQRLELVGRKVEVGIV